jgi:DNA-binding protein H-NS
MSKKLNLDAMSIDEMWKLHEETSRVLAVRLTMEKRQLEKKLAQLGREKELRPLDPIDTRSLNGAPRVRRKYPRVFPKYRNPKEPFETWSGRGKQPRWLAAALNTGRTIEEFMIRNAESAALFRTLGVRSRSAAAAKGALIASENAAAPAERGRNAPT